MANKCHVLERKGEKPLGCDYRAERWEKSSAARDQVNSTVAQVDRITQQNAAGTEESASAAEELSVQAQTVKGAVEELALLVSGNPDGQTTGKSYQNTASASARGVASPTVSNAPAPESSKPPCWDVKDCPTDRRDNCPAYPNEGSKCWMVTGTMCGGSQQGSFIHKMQKCKACNVYELHSGKEPVAAG